MLEKKLDSEGKGASFMLRRIKILIFSVMVLLTLSPALWAEGTGVQFPQGPQLPLLGDVVRGETITVEMKPGMLNILKRPPLSFKPFTLEELGLSPNREVLLKNGKRIKAEDLLRQINELERKFNELGYSLREKGDVVIQTTRINKTMYEQTRQVFLKSHSQLPNFFVPSLSQRILTSYKPSFTSMAGRFLLNTFALSPEAMKKEMEITKNIAELMETRLRKSKEQEVRKFKLDRSFSKKIGDEDMLAVGIDASLNMDGERDKITLTAKGKATGWVLDKASEIVYAEARMHSEKEKADASLNVRALGYDLWNNRWDTFLSIRKEHKKGIDQSYTGSFMIGPIPVSITLGFKGEVGIEYGIYLVPTHISGQVSPYIDTRCYAEAGVGLEVVNAGAGAELTFFKDRFNLQGDLGVEMSLDDEFFFVVRYSGENEIEALNGKIYAYAEVDYYIDSKKFTYDIFEWDGIKTKGYVIGPEEYVQSLIGGQKMTKETISVVVTKLTTPYPRGFSEIYFGTSAYSSMETPASPTKGFIWFDKEIKWEKEIIPPKDKKVVIVMEVWGPRKADRQRGILEENHLLDVDPNGGSIVLILDLENGTFTGDATGKRGDRIKLKGKDGEIEFYIPIIFKAAPAKAR